MAVGEALFVIDFCCGAPGYSIFSSGDILVVCTESPLFPDLDLDPVVNKLVFI